MSRRGGSQKPRRKPGPRAPLAGLAVAAVHRRCSPIARATAAVLEDLSWKTARKVDGQVRYLPVVMVGYGGTADGKKRPDGLAEGTRHCRRSAMRGVRELERAGLVRVGGETIERKAYSGHRSWFQRVGGRLDDGSGKGRSNDYGPGQALGASVARPRPGPRIDAPADDEAAQRERIEYFERLAADGRARLESRAGP